MTGPITQPAALDRAAQCHPDVRAAELSLQAALADVSVAGEKPNPQLTLGAGSVSRDLGRGSLWNKTFDHQVRIDQTLERGGKPALRREVALAMHEAARADLADARRRARLAAAQAWYELDAAIARREETAAAAEIAAQAQRAQAQRVKAGDAAPIDETRVAVDTLRVQSDLHQAQADVQLARIQLAYALGSSSSAALVAPAAGDSDIPVVAEVDDEAAAVDRRPDVQAARLRLDAAEKARDLARAQGTRDVGIGLQFDHYPISPSNTSGSGNTVSVSVSVPLFVRHAYEGEAARAEADVGAAREALLKAEATARGDFAQARAHRVAADLRARLAEDQMIPSAERVAAGVELAYQRGAIAVLDLLDARRGLRAARIEVINARADRAKANAEWAAAAGGP